MTDQENSCESPTTPTSALDAHADHQEAEAPKKKLLLEPSRFNPPARVGGTLMFLTGVLLLKYELFDLAVVAQHLEVLHFQPLYSMLGGVLVSLGLLSLVFGQHADALLGAKKHEKLPSRWLIWLLVIAPGVVAWGYDAATIDSRTPPAMVEEERSPPP